MVVEAHEEADRLLEEVWGVNLDLVDQGLRIVRQYRLLMSDINCPPLSEFNMLQSRISQLIGSRDDPLPSPVTPPPPTNPMAAEMVNRLLEMVSILDPDIEALYDETHALFELFFPVSFWRVCYIKVTGRCNINDGYPR